MSNKEYLLQLNDKEIRILLTALGKRPFEEVYELIEKIVTLTAGKQQNLPATKKNKAG